MLTTKNLLKNKQFHGSDTERPETYNRWHI